MGTAITMSLPPQTTAYAVIVNISEDFKEPVFVIAAGAGRRKLMMSTRKEIVSGYYDQYDEDGRLSRTRHGQPEYCITMTYIHRYAAKGSRILEVGAGTGRYSAALAKGQQDRKRTLRMTIR